MGSRRQWTVEYLLELHTETRNESQVDENVIEFSGNVWREKVREVKRQRALQ